MRGIHNAIHRCEPGGNWCGTGSNYRTHRRDDKSYIGLAPSDSGYIRDHQNGNLSRYCCDMVCNCDVGYSGDACNWAYNCAYSGHYAGMNDDACHGSDICPGPDHVGGNLSGHVRDADICPDLGLVHERHVDPNHRVNAARIFSHWLPWR